MYNNTTVLTRDLFNAIISIRRAFFATFASREGTFVTRLLKEDKKALQYDECADVEGAFHPSYVIEWTTLPFHSRREYERNNSSSFAFCMNGRILDALSVLSVQ